MRKSGAAALGLVLCASLSACTTTAAPADRHLLENEVAEVERAFADTMARRDHAGFVSFLADEAVFFSGSGPLRGRQAVADAWKPYYAGPEAPFSWAPERVEVLDSGTLALSTGPVRDPGGKPIASFTSIWRREASGSWRIIFDKGNPICANPPAP